MLEIISEIDLDIIKPLWEVCNRHHQVHSRNFKEYFRDFKFEDMKDVIHSYDSYGLDVVYLKKKPLGFCVAGINGDMGSIIGLYIYDDLRGKGLGGYLIKRMQLQLKTKEALHINFEIYAGNEEVIGFLKKNGFKTSKYVMEFIDNGGEQ